MPFLVGAGELNEPEMTAAYKALATFWECELRKFSCNDSPNEILSSLQEDQGLFQLIGDAAITNGKRGSWLEALAAWRMPTILICTPLLNGLIPGVSSSYVALCRELSIPLVGIVQLGGIWDVKNRSLDGLPWCGCIPNRISKGFSLDSIEYLEYQIDVEVLGINLKKRMALLDI